MKNHRSQFRAAFGQSFKKEYKSFCHRRQGLPRLLYNIVHEIQNPPIPIVSINPQLYCTTLTKWLILYFHCYAVSTKAINPLTLNVYLVASRHGMRSMRTSYHMHDLLVRVFAHRHSVDAEDTVARAQPRAPRGAMLFHRLDVHGLVACNIVIRY